MAGPSAEVPRNLEHNDAASSTESVLSIASTPDSATEDNSLLMRSVDVVEGFQSAQQRAGARGVAPNSVPIVTSEEKISELVELCVRKFDMPADIDRKLLTQALRIEEDGGYRKLQKIGDIAQQEVLYKIACDIGCSTGLMEKFLKQSVGLNKFQHEMTEKYGLNECIFTKCDPIPKLAIKLTAKKGLANSFEAILGAVSESNVNGGGRSKDKLIQLNRVLKVFNLDFDGALVPILNEDVKVHNMTMEEAKVEAQQCQLTLRRFEEQFPELAWWKMTMTMTHTQMLRLRFRQAVRLSKQQKDSLIHVFRQVRGFIHLAGMLYRWGGLPW